MQQGVQQRETHRKQAPDLLKRGQRVRHPQSIRWLSTSDAAFLFHALGFLFYVRVFLWHFSARAQQLPGAIGFGWFFRYLTFCSWTIQMIFLGLACLAKTTQAPARQRWLAAWADDLACFAFGLAHCVTVMYYSVDRTTKLALQSSDLRPPWLGPTVHVVNTVVAWLDMLLAEQRTFSRRSRHISFGFTLAYALWVLLCARVEGKFLYPFLNTFPFPQAFLATAAAGTAMLALVFEFGRWLSWHVIRRSTLADRKQD
ncbi:hypothetical protein WJX84_010457 [Apatococcus fuscideae]|uniref:Uncharacterized protein n=1 Tax=Apatococcus fuscideae TaxID=2026836 RepID=A0AAW1SLA7_9CHLO